MYVKSNEAWSTSCLVSSTVPNTCLEQNHSYWKTMRAQRKQTKGINCVCTTGMRSLAFWIDPFYPKQLKILLNENKFHPKAKWIMFIQGTFFNQGDRQLSFFFFFLSGEKLFLYSNLSHDTFHLNFL